MAGMAALQKLLTRSGDKGMELLEALKSGGSRAMNSTPNEAIGALGKMGSEGMDALGKMGSKGLSAIDGQLAKVPFMQGKQDPLAMTDPFVDERKRNALLAALGLGGAGASAYGINEMMDE